MHAINEVFFRFSRGPVSPKEYEIGQDVICTVKGTITKTSDSDNQDGTVDRVYIIKPVEITCE